jgi:hypothetical protein
MKYQPVTCADGFRMSVQASDTTYCEPRSDGAAAYSSCEVGYPSMVEGLLLEYAEDKEKPTETVYGWVPSQTIALVCAKHGGIVSGELPPGIPFLKAPEEAE